MRKLLAVTAVLFLTALVVPSIASARQFTFEEMKFFERGYNVPNYDQKVYATRFPRSTSRYIFCEVSFINHLYGIRDQQVTLTLKYYNSDGSLLAEPSNSGTIKSEWDNFWISAGYGWSSPGKWPSGKYTVQAFLDGAYVGQSSFTIHDDETNLQFEELKFFESGRGMPKYGKRVYATRFSQNTARHINCEATFINKLFLVRDQWCKVTMKYYNLDGSFWGEAECESVVKSQWFSHYFSGGWGWKNPGNWPVGRYTVDVYLEGVFVAKGHFEVYSSQHINNDPFEIGKKIAMSGRFELNHVWVKDNWHGDGVKYSFHITYSKSCGLICFVERPLSRKGLEIMWSKDYRNNRYVKLIGNVNGEIVDTIYITREQAEKEAWRILKYFGY